ncbi:hypothetical protein JMJ77_0008742, partial [Colletotrichum scovillei]
PRQISAATKSTWRGGPSVRRPLARSPGLEVPDDRGTHKRRENPISNIEEADAASCLSRNPPFMNWKPKRCRLSIVD